MNEQDLIKLGNTLIAKWSLTGTGWKVVINRRLRSTEARCVRATRTIELNPRCWEMDDPEQTILHEIAHAIHFERIKDLTDLRPSEEESHGKMWQTISAEIGYLVPDYYL